MSTYPYDVYTKDGKKYVKYLSGPVSLERLLKVESPYWDKEDTMHDFILNIIDKGYLGDQLNGFIVKYIEEDDSYNVECTLDHSFYKVMILGVKFPIKPTKDQIFLFEQAIEHATRLYNNFVGEFHKLLELQIRREQELLNSGCKKEDLPRRERIKITSYGAFRYSEELTEITKDKYDALMKEERLCRKWKGKYYSVKRKHHEEFWDITPPQVYTQIWVHFDTALDRYYSGVSEAPKFHALKKVHSFSVCNQVVNRKATVLRVVSPRKLGNGKYEKGYLIFKGLGKNYVKGKSRKAKEEREKLERIEISNHMTPLSERQENETYGYVKTATFSRDSIGKWYCALNILSVREQENPVRNKSIEEGSIIGIDFNVAHPYKVSNGEEIKPFRGYERALKDLKRLQHVLSHKKKGSKKYKKIAKKIASKHRKIKNLRKEFSHRLSTRLVKENQAIFVEGLKIKKLIKKNKSRAAKKFNRLLMDSGWYEFTRMLEYKCYLQGKIFGRIAENFPSSQKCSCCGVINPQMKNLWLRTLKCKGCGIEIDRDLNAAINIRARGIEEFLKDYTLVA